MITEGKYSHGRPTESIHLLLLLKGYPWLQMSKSRTLILMLLLLLVSYQPVIRKSQDSQLSLVVPHKTLCNGREHFTILKVDWFDEAVSLEMIAGG